MKKILLAAIFLLNASISYAGTITYDQAQTNSDFTRTWLNSTFDRVYNEVNGNLTSANLSSNAVASDDIATHANPLVRENELIGEMVYSGLTIATSANLATTIIAGTAYVTNDGDATMHRVVTADTARTFTASRDTWVYLNYVGAFSYTEVANGAAAPATPLNSIAIATVVTDGDNITSVTDRRQTTPTNLRIYNDYIQGCVISRDISSNQIVTLGNGEIEFGSSVTAGRRRNATTTNVNFAATGRGGLDTGSQAANTFYYVWALADDDNSTAYEGIASLSSTDATGVTGERLIGWAYSATASVISADSVGSYKGVGSNAPNVVYRQSNTDITNTSATFVNMPVFDDVRFYSSGRPVAITICLPLERNDAGSAGAAVQLAVDSINLISRDVGMGATDEPIPFTLNYIGKFAPGTHTAAVQWRTLSGGTIASESASKSGARTITIIEH